jgi:hypothetical protein
VTFIFQKGLQNEFAVGCQFELVGLKVIDENLQFRFENFQGTGGFVGIILMMSL